MDESISLWYPHFNAFCGVNVEILLGLDPHAPFVLRRHYGGNGLWHGLASRGTNFKTSTEQFPLFSFYCFLKRFLFMMLHLRIICMLFTWRILCKIIWTLWLPFSTDPSSYIFFFFLAWIRKGSGVSPHLATISLYNSDKSLPSLCLIFLAV